MPRPWTSIAVAVLLTFSLVPSGQAALRLPDVATTSAGPGRGGPSTPELISEAELSGRIDGDTALRYLAFAMFAPSRLPPDYRSDTPWRGTVPLLRLREAADSGRFLGEGANDLIDHLSPGLVNCSVFSAAPTTHAMVTDHFRIEYVPGTIGGGLTIRDYAESLETAWVRHVDEFGWAAPPLSGSRYKVRVDRTLPPGLYGFVASTGNVGQNPNATDWSTHDAQTSCMGLNADYAPFPGSARDALDATTAHEFHHSVQFGYGALSPNPASAFSEGLATWMEDEIQDQSNDNYNYLWPQFSSPMGSYSGSPYPYWITFRGLTERFGTGMESGGQRVMRAFWRTISESNSAQTLSALQGALQGTFGIDLAVAYHDYAIAAGALVACGGGYAYPHCFEEAAGYVSVRGRPSPHGTVARGGSFSGSVADHFALNWVALPTNSGTFDVTLDDRSAQGVLRATAVCDTGSGLRLAALGALPVGGASTASFDSQGCVRAVLVVTNERVSGPRPYSVSNAAYDVTAS